MTLARPLRTAPSLFARLLAGMLALSSAALLKSMGLHGPGDLSQPDAGAPGTCVLPVVLRIPFGHPKTTPGGHPQAAAHLSGQASPRGCHSSAETGCPSARRDIVPAALRFRSLRRDQRHDQRPQLIGYKRCHYSHVNMPPPQQFRFCCKLLMDPGYTST